MRCESADHYPQSRRLVGLGLSGVLDVLGICAESKEAYCAMAVGLCEGAAFAIELGWAPAVGGKGMLMLLIHFVLW